MVESRGDTSATGACLLRIQVGGPTHIEAGSLSPWRGSIAMHRMALKAFPGR